MDKWTTVGQFVRGSYLDMPRSIFSTLFGSGQGRCCLQFCANLFTYTKFGERAFSHAGPATWNALPDHIRTVAGPVKFQKLLKSHYFSQAFKIC